MWSMKQKWLEYHLIYEIDKSVLFLMDFMYHTHEMSDEHTCEFLWNS